MTVLLFLYIIMKRPYHKVEIELPVIYICVQDERGKENVMST